MKKKIIKSNNVAEIAYKISKGVYESTIEKKEGVRELATISGINEGSAKIIVVQIFPKLVNGQVFTRTLSFPFFDYFLNNILKDYGIEGLTNALHALKLHIEYGISRGDAKISLKKVYRKYLDVINKTDDLDEKEQEEIVATLKKERTKQEIIKELNNLKHTDPIMVVIKGKAYKRNNKTIAQIKFIRDFKCQICDLTIIKKDGNKYIEAAHITPKHLKGIESPDNIILLCPNHHKEFDLGVRLDIKHTIEVFEFVLNGITHRINLNLE